MSSINKNYPPKARKKLVKRKVHNIELSDHFDWIRDNNWQEVLNSPNVLKKNIRKYIDEENKWTDKKLSFLKPIEKKIFREIKNKIKEEDTSIPEKDGNWFYYSETKKNKEYSILRRYKSNSSRKKSAVYHDWNKESKPYKYFKPGGAFNSSNHSLLAWSFDNKGSEFYQIRVKDLSQGKHLKDNIKDTDGSIVWSLNNDGFYYIKLDKNHRPSSLYFHLLGTHQNKDIEIYNERDSGYFLNISETLSKKYLVLNIHNHETSEVRIINQEEKNKKLKLIAKRKKTIEYSIEHDQENSRFLILTNKDNAIDFKLMETNENELNKKNWIDFLPYKEGTLITNFSCLAQYIIVQELENGLPRIVVINKKNKKKNIIKFDEEIYDLDFFEGCEYQSNKIKIYYSSMATPLLTYDYKLKEQKKRIIKKQQIPSGHNEKNYNLERVYAISHDGKKIPISIIRRKDTPKNAPTLLYGYGSYGISISPSFSVSRLSLVDRGMVYAIAHIRGGMEKGKKWYEDGKKKNKLNSFKDFITCAEFLKKENISENITIHGGSAGGLLIGASINISPDTFHCAIAEVPFVDVLNTILDDTLPLTPPEWEEWGNPIKNKSDFDYIGSYSPYDNIKEQNYPTILATSGLTDPRVTYWEATKWIAKLRSKKINDNPIFLKTYTEAGHGGMAGRYNQIKETAFIYAFILWRNNLIKRSFTS